MCLFGLHIKQFLFVVVVARGVRASPRAVVVDFESKDALRRVCESPAAVIVGEAREEHGRQRCPEVRTVNSLVLGWIVNICASDAEKLG